MDSVKAKKKDIILRNRKLVCKNSVFNVFLDDIETENGQSVQDYLVIAPLNETDNMVTGVAVLPVFGERIGLIKIYRHAIRDYLWELPRGFIEKGESSKCSAMRELEEETGFYCHDSSLRSLGIITPEAGILAARVELFVATECTKVRELSINELGHKELRLFVISDIRSMIDDSEIQDPCTLVAFYKYLNPG